MGISKYTWISICNGLILLLLTISEFSGWLKFGLLFSYQWHKVLHLAGVVMMMGNMITSAVWFSYAYYSPDKTLLKFAVRLLQITDVYLTLPGVALAVLNGLVLASAFGGTRQLPWLFYSVILLLVMWALSIPVLYIQEKIYKAVDKGLDVNKLIVQWGIWGTLVMVPPVIIFYWMVIKSV